MEPRPGWSFEVFVDDFNNIKAKGEEVYEQTSSTLDTQTIAEKFYYIFEWCSCLILILS
jgi:lipoprotein-releasing system permease protein